MKKCMFSASQYIHLPLITNLIVNTFYLSNEIILLFIEGIVSSKIFLFSDYKY